MKNKVLYNKQCKTGSDAFTLIEVLVAVAILSTSIVLIMQAFDTSIVALSISRETVIANHLARERLAAIRLAALNQDPLAASDGSGRFAKPYSDYGWEVIADTVDAGNTAHSNILKKVEINISRDGSKRRYSTLTYLRVHK